MLVQLWVLTLELVRGFVRGFALVGPLRQPVRWAAGWVRKGVPSAQQQVAHQRWT
jgi:hypothetical protein